MSADVTEQLRTYFSALDEDQTRADLTVIAHRDHDRPKILNAHQPAPGRQHDSRGLRWLVPAAVLATVVGSLLMFRNDTETSRAAGLPSGTIVFEAQDRDARRASDIYVMELDGSQAIRLTDHAGPDRHPSWSPDGTRIVFDSNRAPLGEDVGIYVMDANGANVTRIGTGHWPHWSPAGDTILYQDGFGVFTMNADGSDATHLVDGRDPSWSPDGTQIVFSRQTESSEPLLNYELFTINVDGTNETQLTETPDRDEFLPAWSPDGTRIAHLSDWELHVMNSDGTDNRRVPEVEVQNILGPSVWSPDSDYLAYITFEFDDEGRTPTGLTIINAASLETTSRLQTHPPYIDSVSWR